MQSKVIPAQVDSQISEYVNQTYPLFSEFLKVYFEYASKKNNSYHTILNHRSYNDIDLADDATLDKFYDTYGEYLPKELAYDKRNLVKFLNELYAAKGTEKALKLLFKLIFNSEINITYPGDNLLRVSDGEWVQDQFFIMNTAVGSIPFVGEYLESFEDSNIFILIDKLEYISDRKYRIYFKTPQKITFFDGMKFKCTRNEELVYVGILENTLVSIKILEPGSSWMNGQIFKIPGSTSDTLVKVTKTKNYGQVSSVSIIEHGWQHSQNQVVTVSSYALKPIGTTYDVEVVGNTITLTIVDNLSYIDENIKGFSDGTYTDDLNWNTDFYTGLQTIDVRLVSIRTPESQLDSSISIEAWLQSRAKFECTYGPIGKKVGHFKTGAGQLSNDIIKLQDSYYYQVFSYLIETAKDIKDYKELLNITHPAGTIRFSALEKLFVNNFSVNAKSDVRYITNDVYLDLIDLDKFSLSDQLSINTQKAIEDVIAFADLIGITLNKPLEETISIAEIDSSSMVVDSGYVSDYFDANYTSYVTTLTIGQ